MKGPVLLLLSAVALTQSLDPVSSLNARKCNCDPSEAWKICDANFGIDNVKIAHEFCDKFYLCDNGRPVAIRCPAGLLYNPLTEECDWSQNIDCGDRPISDGTGVPDPDCDNDNPGDGGIDQPGADSDDDDNSAGGGDDATVGGGHWDPSKAPEICAANNSEGVLVAHENCNQFYICNGGRPVVLTCPDNTLFNPDIDTCDWPANVDCGDRGIPDPEDNDNGGNDNDDCDNGGGDNDDGDNGGGDDSESDNEGGDNGGTCNCRPEEAPKICAAEGSDGVLVAHENCNQFYKCIDGKPVAQTCPGTLLYNPYTEQCDWPENVDCGDRIIPVPEDNDSDDDGDNDIPDDGGIDQPGADSDDDGDNGGTCNCRPEEAPEICAAEGSDGVLVAHENCNQFYKCAYGKPISQTCPDNLLYNPHTEQCDWPEKVDCGDRVIPPPEDNDGGDDNGGGDNDNGEDGDQEIVGGGNCDPSEAPTICAAEDSEGVFVAHENCNQFYVCNGGIPVVLTCPKGLLFNPNTDRCDWPGNVNCGDRVIPDPEDNDNGGGDNDGNDNGGGDNDDSDNGGGGGDNDNNDNGGACNCRPEEAPEICAADGSDGILVPHENCNQFYKCAQGKPIAQTCPGTLLYNHCIRRCDWPQNVYCGDRVIPDPNDNDNGGDDNGGSDNDNGDDGEQEIIGGGNCDPSEAPTICAAEDSEGVFVAHENCNQFYVCNGGIPVVLTCPKGLLFNPNIDRCDWPANVNCGDRVIPDPEDNDNGGGDNGGNDNDGGDNDDSDNGGVDNDDNDNGGACNCRPEEAPEICAADGSDGVLVAHENCNQFYNCVHGKPVAQTCPGTLLYNPYIERCDWPHNVDCGDRVIPDPNDNDNGGDDNGGGDNDNGDDVEQEIIGGGNCDPSEAPTICAADDSEGVFVAHENCNQFYVCNGGKPVVLTCPKGLLFNPNTDRCDWPANVNCGDRVIPDPEDNDNGGGDNGGNDNDGGDNDDSDNGGVDNDDNDNGGACNCRPEEAPEICAADGSDGVLIAHENCNQFYKCAYGKPVTQTCPGTLLYNPYTEQCDWPKNVDCGDRVIPVPEDNDNDGGENDIPDDGGIDLPGADSDDDGDNGGSCNCRPEEAPEICAADGSDGVLIAHENCNQFYKCAYGKPVAQTCPGTLLYNPYTKQCDWPENVDCGDRVIPDPNDNDNGGDDNGSGDNDNGNDGEQEIIGGGNCDPSEAPTICAAEDSEGVFVAHENCNQFYVCNGGKPVVLTCPKGLLFNPNTDRCDWPANVNCGDRVIPDPEDNDNGEGDNGGNDNGGGDNDDSDNGGVDNDDNDNGGACNCRPEEAPEICAADGSDGALIAHENCNQFYKCAYGKPVTQTCPGTLLYNPYTEQCDWPKNVNCGDRVIPVPEDNDNDGGENDIPDDGGIDLPGADSDDDGDNGGTCNCRPEEAPEICAAEGSDGVLVAHENCNQFYKCVDSKPVAQTCPGTLLYNPQTEQCDWPENVDCGDRVIPVPEDNDNDGGDNEGGDNDAGDNDGGENEGVDNDAGDNDGGDSGGNDDNNVNDDPSQAPAICAESGSDGTLVAHENCNQYYMCAGGRTTVFTCPGDLLFNPLIPDCDWPRSVDCGDRLLPERDDCYCDPRRAPALCSFEELEGVMIAHENCNQFYVCVSGVPVARSCPGLLYYNPRKQVCDWPINVDCDTRVAGFRSLNKHLESRQTVRK